MRCSVACFFFSASVLTLGCSGASSDDGSGGTTETSSSATGNDDTTTGDGDGCTGGAPLPAPFCENPDCNYACGCEECVADQVHCPEYDDAVMQECSADGTCVDDVACADGNHCIPITSTSGRCSETYSCDELADIYSKQVSKTSCADDDQCQVLAGHCDVGLGDCWHATNPQAKAAVLDELAARWSESTCGQDSCGGDCGAMPTAKCIDNVCVLE